MKIFEYNNRNINDKSEDLLRFVVVDNIEGLKNHPKVKQLHITGLKQKDFDLFVENFANNYEFIYFFKCPYISNFTKLSELKNIKYLSFTWNNKASNLWDMTNNTNLKGLFVNDFSKLHDISVLETANSLVEFHLSGGMWKNAKIDSFVPIAKLPNLKFLSLIGVDVQNNDITPLFNLKSLKELRLLEETYSMETYAALSVKLPNTQCDCFKGYVEDSIIAGKDIKIVGKGKPRLHFQKDKKKLEKYLDEFEKYKQQYL